MTTTPLIKPKPAKAGNALFTYARGIAFITIQVLAALALDGWLSVALWINVGWNVLTLVVMTTGLAIIAAKAINREQA